MARGLLREILGGYLALPPARLRFEQNAWGKPMLAECAVPLRFNVAHTADVALYAVAMDRPVGIDVEQIRPVEHLDRLVARYFSPAERAAFGGLRLSPRQQLTAFFATWVRKEAYMKARGAGFALPLSAFDVTVAPDDPPQLLADRHHPDEWARWTLRDLPVASGYRASLAIRGDLSGVTFWLFRNSPGAIVLFPPATQ